VMDALAKSTGGALKSFFVAHGLGDAFENKQNRVDNRPKKVADAIAAAERRDGDERVLLAAVDAFELGHLIAAYVVPGLPELISAVQQRPGWENVQRMLTAAAAEAHTNPAGAITASRSAIESVCKHICDERGADYKDSDDLPVLYKKTLQALNLTPEQPDIDRAVQQTLQGAVTVVYGLAALRNAFGDAHGKGKGVPGTPEAYGALAVNMATGVTGLLLDAHNQ
jgi:hypothetical protein